MTKLSTSMPIIEIQWRGGASGVALPVGQQPAKEGLLELARALGRLAARRDQARAVPGVAGEGHTAGEIEDRMEAEPV